MRGCRHARHRILRSADGELELEERFLLDEHLARCPSCAELHARTLVLEETLARLPEPPHERLDLDRAAASVGAAIAARSDSLRHPIRPPVPGPIRRALASAPGRILVVAAGLVAVLVLAATLLRGPFSGGPGGQGVPHAGATASVEREHPAAFDTREAPEGPEEPDDPAGVERLVRANLVTALDGLAIDADADSAARRFDELTFELRRWPIVRVVEKLLADDDPRVARSAARYLGVRGDRISVSKLRASLDRPPVAPAAVRALGDLGEPATPALRQALDDPALELLALRELRGVGGKTAARAIADALLARTRSPFERAVRMDPYLEALAGTGAAAVDVLLDLCAVDGLDEREVLSWLDAVEQGAPALARLLEVGGGGHPTPLLLEAAARLQPVEALAWLEERCQEARHRDAALACIARWDGTAPLASLLRLDAAGWVDDEDLLATLRDLAERDRDGRRIAEHARELVAAHDVLGIQRCLELLIASEHPAAARALVLFASSDLLSDDERQWAALAVGELGRPDDAVLLLRGLVGQRPTDRRLWAACLITIHRHLGDDGAAEALAGIPEWSARRVRGALADVAAEGLGAVGLNRVARALPHEQAALLHGSKNRKTKNWNSAL